tara:strand:+ start:27174 stop:28055 length:882 start_codon:yes stop_codon:yes gene_type:complete
MFNSLLLFEKNEKSALRQTGSLRAIYNNKNYKYMAIYHLCVKTFSRAKGHSAIAAAAYRTGKKLIDFRTGETHDYRKKNGVVSSFITVPESIPDWALSSESLWNQAEKSENRKNSTIAREIEISLPYELSSIGQRNLALKLATEICKKHCVVVETSIHKPHESNDQRNIHAHLLLSTRRLNKEGFHEKSREFDGAKLGSETVKFWRKRWEELANEALKNNKVPTKIDHRSYKKRGLALEPTQHQGSYSTQMERRGLNTRIGVLNKSIQQRNYLVIRRRRLNKRGVNLSSTINP